MVRALAHLGICVGVVCLFAALPLSCLLIFAASSSAQSQTQQYVYADIPGSPTTTSSLAAMAKNGQNGGLSSVSGSPFPDRLEGGRLAVDALGRFLFVLNPNTNGISMFQINSSTGALTEVPGSPFSAGKTINPNQAPAQPVSLATEKSGKYLYVGYTSGNISQYSAITPFVIDTASLRLTLTDQLSFDVSFNPLQMFSDPRGLFLYVVDGSNPFTLIQNGGATVYSITATDGSLNPNGSAGGGSNGRSMASDPQGRFFYSGNGQFSGSLSWGTISPLDGTSAPNQAFLNLGENNFPVSMVVDSSGKFLYVQQTTGLVIYSIDQTTGQPTPLTSPQASPTFQLGNVAADPAGAFLYTGAVNGIRAFQVNAQDGSLSEVSGSPFSAGGQALYVAISGTAIQASSGPSAAFTPTSIDFGSVTEGQQVTRDVHLVNNGTASLAINLGSAAITGTNAADFSQTTTCIASLSPNANCTFSIAFKPTTTASESASLQVSDNAPGSPQVIPLAGAGLAPSPSLAFSPGNLNFNAIAQGQLEGPQTIQIANIGSATLHISSIALGGANPQDFSQTNTCVSVAIAVNASCNISVSFTPQATGQRSASLTLTDDAPTQSQTLFVQGNGTVAFQLNPALSSATTASVIAGQTAQYNLQLNPGTSFTGNVSISCAGAPTAAKCNLSSGTLSVSSSNPVSFAVSVSTTGAGSGVFPQNSSPRFEPPRGLPQLVGMFLIACLCIAFQKRLRTRRSLAFAVLLLAMFIGYTASGCGGASTEIQPPPQATPKGIYTITVSGSSNNLPTQTIALTLTVN